MLQVLLPALSLRVLSKSICSLISYNDAFEQIVDQAIAETDRRILTENERLFFVRQEEEEVTSLKSPVPGESGALFLHTFEDQCMPLTSICAHIRAHIGTPEHIRVVIIILLPSF